MPINTTIFEGTGMNENTNTARTHTAQLPAPMRLPATTIRVASWQRVPAAQWDREQALDAAGCIDELDAASLERVAAEMADIAQELAVATEAVKDVRRQRRQVEADLDRTRRELRAVRSTLDETQTRLAETIRSRDVAEHDLDVTAALLEHERAESAKLRAELEALRAGQVTVALERLTMTVTGSTLTELTAQLNEHVRSSIIDTGDVVDAEVIDLDGLDGDISDRTRTVRIPLVTQAQLVASHGGRS